MFGIVRVWIVQSKCMDSSFSIQNMHRFDQVVYKPIISWAYEGFFLRLYNDGMGPEQKPNINSGRV